MTKEKNTETELEEARAKAQEYLDNWKRERADFLNYKKDEAKRLGDIAKFANEAIILEIISVLDNVEMAMRHVPEKLEEEHKEWLEGMKQASKGFDELLRQCGVEKIDASGKFNPELHEAVSQEDGEDVEEVRAGYTMHGKVIRPARVKILSKN